MNVAMWRGIRPGALVAIAAMVIAAGAFVVLSVRQPAVATFVPTPPSPRDVGRALVGPTLYTVDATDGGRWRHFSFRLGSVVDDPGARDWDLAFRRYQVIVNGGARFAGGGGALDLGRVAFADVRSVPEGDYRATEGDADPRNPALAGWYRYSYLNHTLAPKPRVWAIRTADGRYAKLEFVSYYCHNMQPGCVTFRYVYQGDGSRRVAGPSVSPPSTAAMIGPP